MDHVTLDLGDLVDTTHEIINWVRLITINVWIHDGYDGIDVSLISHARNQLELPQHLTKVLCRSCLRSTHTFDVSTVPAVYVHETSQAPHKSLALVQGRGRPHTYNHTYNAVDCVFSLPEGPRKARSGHSGLQQKRKILVGVVVCVLAAALWHPQRGGLGWPLLSLQEQQRHSAPRWRLYYNQVFRRFSDNRGAWQGAADPFHRPALWRAGDYRFVQPAAQFACRSIQRKGRSNNKTAHKFEKHAATRTSNKDLDKR